LDTGAARRGGGDDEQVGGMAVDDVAQLAVQLEAVGARLPGGGDGIAVPLSAEPGRLGAGPGQGGGQATVDDGRQVLLLLLVIAGHQQAADAQADGAEEGRAQQHPPHLLQHRAELDIAQAHAAVLLRHMDRLEAQVLADALPQRRVITGFGRHGLAYRRGGRHILEEGPGGIADHLLLFGEAELHGDSSAGQAPYTGCAGTSAASSACMASPTSAGNQRSPLSTPSVVRQPSAMEILPPSASNTRPVTWAASALASQASSELTFSGAQ